MSDPMQFAGIVGIRDAVTAGSITSETAINTAFERATASQHKLKAFTFLPSSLSMAKINADAPLAGIAVAVKDLIDTADMATTYGSPIYRDHTRLESGEVAEKHLI